MDKGDREEERCYNELKIQRRIKANRIIGYMQFRNTFSSHEGRHSWDLCGKPVYYWALKSAAQSKYMEKIIVWTEVEEALDLANSMSDKFIPIKREIKDCTDRKWQILDDLKTPKSTIVTGMNSMIIREKLNFEPTLTVTLSANCPLLSPENNDKLIEKYFEDDLANIALQVFEIEPCLYIENIRNPKYLFPIFHYRGYERRQQYPPLYRAGGSSIYTSPAYEKRHDWFLPHINMQRIVKVIIPQEEGKEIHNENDLELARFYMEARLKKKS